MFLKSLALRGFKSFPDKTSLVFEPGITIIVGPNGSGKSNLVDAVSWVLGEQGPRSLRGGKMEDVIFAGSRLRPALGMAEVTLTIDNSAGLLPIDFSEVTISRILFRSGESEYRLNGAPCRLLDISEVLSDSGIGREQHTIIGQGQLDEILQADPGVIRGFIEEAAGVTKHRRRKERALRKMAATEHNLARLADLASEIRRQLRPLRQQAEMARRYGQMNEELSRVGLVQAARELAALTDRMGPGGSRDPDAPIREKESELNELEARLADLERRRADLYRVLEEKRELTWALSRIEERVSGLVRLAEERARGLEAALAGSTEEAASARVAEVEREIAEAEQMLGEAAGREAEAEGQSGRASVEAEEASASARSIEDRLAPLRASHRESLAELVRVRGEIGALEGSLDSSREEVSRLESRRFALEKSAEDATGRLREARREAEGLEAAESSVAARVEQIETEVAGIERERSAAEEAVKEARVEASLWEARSHLRAGSEATAAAVAARGLPGVIGVFAGLIEFSAEYRAAVEAIAGRPEGALVVDDSASVREVFAAAGGEPLTVLVAPQGPPPTLGEGALSLAERVEVRHPAAGRVLEWVFVVQDVDEAARLAAENPGCTFVTLGGAVATASLVSRGAADAARQAGAASHHLGEAEARLAGIEGRLELARQDLAGTITELNEAGAAVSAAADSVADLDREIHALGRELSAVIESEEQGRHFMNGVETKLEPLRARLPEIEESIRLDQAELERLQEEHGRAQLAHQSAAESLEQARMQAARASERRRLLEERLSSLAAARRAAIQAASGVDERRAWLTEALGRVRGVAGACPPVIERAALWGREAEDEYQGARRTLEELETQVGDLRSRRAGLAGAIDDLRGAVRRRDAEMSEFVVRARILEERMREEWQMEPETAVSRYGHVWEVEDESRITEPLERLAILEPEALQRRRARLERDLEGMGRINPLAAQEFESLNEREAFLSEQMADVRKSRRDLLKLVDSIDERIRELFITAFEDVAGEFERLFVLLFPGGQGRLRMVDPSDPLVTGIEIEARPGGKNLRRLSLLSGGEKALSALAFLFAIFRARPSPFYVLDEVEAALDDVNLHRFLQLLMEFRSTSQLLVVTHQKRTMEVGDVLYGVSITPEGASRVISQKMPGFSGTEPARRSRIPADN